MLSDEKVRELVRAMSEWPAKGTTMKVAALVAQWISEAEDAAVWDAIEAQKITADALESGELPDGYRRWTEYGGFGFDPAPEDAPCCVDDDGDWIKDDHPTYRQHVVITGPWREAEQ